MSSANKSIFIALDGMNKEEIFKLLEETASDIPHIKIGLELFNKYGPSIVKEISDRFSVEIFLDLKLHDIPNTVAGAITSLKGLPIKFLTLHLSGGREMLKRAMRAKDEHLPDCNILGVSILTSLDAGDLKEIWGIEESEVAFTRLFELAAECKIDGVVCSPKELSILKSFPNQLKSVCPGVRFRDEIESGNLGDQKRVLSVEDAFANGADYLVMGRSLTKSSDIKARISQLKGMA